MKYIFPQAPRPRGEYQSVCLCLVLKQLIEKKKKTKKNTEVCQKWSILSENVTPVLRSRKAPVIGFASTQVCAAKFLLTCRGSVCVWHPDSCPRQLGPLRQTEPADWTICVCHLQPPTSRFITTEQAREIINRVPFSAAAPLKTSPFLAAWLWYISCPVELDWLTYWPPVACLPAHELTREREPEILSGQS